MSHPFRLALVGAGMITQQSHLPAALASTMAEVAVIVDPVVERAAELARAYGITPRIASRVEEVLADIEGAVIATPNDSHSAIAIACLRAGVPTLIEKPLASTYQAGLEIVRTAKEAGKVVAVGYSTRFRDNILLLKALLEERHFGAVTRFVHQFGTSGGWAPLSAYNLNLRTAGGGVLVVSGSHFLDRMLYFWGYPDEVSLEDDGTGGPEANCTARFRYASSGMPSEGIARYSKTVRLPAGLVMETTEGYIVLGDSDDADIIFRAHSNPEIEQVIRRRDHSARFNPKSEFQRQLEDFIDACRGKHLPRVDGQQGLDSLRLIEQLYSSRQVIKTDYYQRAETLLQ